MTNPGEPPTGRRLTRRHLLAAGGVLAGTASLGLWGRHALGNEFERHVAAQLGLDLELVSGLLARMRAELDDYHVRAAAFLVATQGPLDDVVPYELRRKAIDSFLGPMLGLSRGLVVPLAFAGLRDSPDYVPCSVLVRPD